MTLSAALWFFELFLPFLALPAAPVSVAIEPSVVVAPSAPAPEASVREAPPADREAAPARRDPAPAPAVATPSPSATAPAVAPRAPHRAPPSGCEAPALPTYESVASGRADNGRLRRGTFVPESDTIRHVDAHGCHFWGTTELARAIERVAASIAADAPGARLTIGELSKRHGGDIRGHASHENGLDVDFGFYWKDARGRHYEPGRFVDVRPDKTTVVDGRKLTFDTARNWAIIEGFLTDPEVDLAIVLVDIQVRQWLLDHARRTGVDRELRRRAARVLRIPNPGAHPHLNHFHLRIFCPESDRMCRDKNELHDWVVAERAAANESLAAN